MRGTVKGKTYDEYVDRLLEIDTFLDKIRLAKANGKDIPYQVLERAVELKKEREDVEIIVRCWDRSLEFMYEFFSEDRNPGNSGNIVPAGLLVENAPDFHQELSAYLDTFMGKPTQRFAWSVSRGHAKSSYLSNMYPVYNIVHSLRHYIIVVSETNSGAIMFTEWINNQLKFNEKLRRVYGVMLSTNVKENAKDNSEIFVTHNNIKVQAASIGKQLRGSRHLNYRPDLIIADDLESARNTATPELREKNLHWWNSVVMPMGDPTATGIIYMGTLVHPSGLLPAVMERADFKSRRYSAIISPPTHQELWERYEEIYRDQENPDRLTDAENFYTMNREKMDEGVETLWADRFPFYKLMQEKVNIGTRAFNSEFLNIGHSDEDAIFKSDMFVFFDDKDLYDSFGRKIPLDLYGFWDIAITGKGDYNVIATLGRDHRTGIFYVLDIWAKKCNMHEALDMAAKKIIEHRHHTFGVETIQAQWSMYKQLQERLAAQGYYSTRLKSVKPTTKKELRIEQLEPIMEQGALRFKRHQRLAIEMFQLFPNHDHDDIPDAIAGAVELAGNRRRRVYREKPAGW